MDWANQPNPFRVFDGARRLQLDLPRLDREPLYDELFEPGRVPAVGLDHGAISRLFRDSLAISAWKQAPGRPAMPLRVNPSSGNLHPTEAYLVAGPVEGLSDEAAVYHYAPSAHILERRIGLTGDEWESLTSQLPPDSVLLALTSIYWRESWKYGERAFRYCHLDGGHAIGAVAFAAAALGWRANLIETVPDDALAILTGIAAQTGEEAEHPDTLLCLFPPQRNTKAADIALSLPDELLRRLGNTPAEGRTNRLSHRHCPWPAIDEVAAATRFTGRITRRRKKVTGDEKALTDGKPLDSHSKVARSIFSQRRSAQEMDGETTISRDRFFRMLARALPRRGVAPFDTLPWRPRVALVIFVHRVEGLERGAYVLIRHPDQEESLRRTLHGSAAWATPEGTPPGLGFFLLQTGDFRRTAQIVSCHQPVASDGAFSLAMLSEFEPALRKRGPSFYPRLFWEAGLVGHVLYLEAEAAGLRATGLGCFFDDTVHRFFGIKNRAWQSLYHITVGKPVEDSRLKTIAPYASL